MDHPANITKYVRINRTGLQIGLQVLVGILGVASIANVTTVIVTSSTPRLFV